MSTLLDELLVTTKVDLTGLLSGLQQATDKTNAAKSSVIQFGTAVDTAAQQQKSLNAQLKESEAIQARIHKQFTGSPLPAVTSSLAQHQKTLNAELKEAEAIQARIHKQSTGSPLAGATSSLAQHQREVNAQLKEAEAIQARLHKQFIGAPLPALSSSLAQYKRELEEAEKAHISLAQRLTASGNAFHSAGMTMTMGITAPLALATTAAAKAALSFDEIITKMQTLAGVSPQMANHMRGVILSMAPQTGQKPTDLAEAAYRIASSGIRDKSRVPEILDSVAKGAAIGMGSATDVGQVVVNTMNAYPQMSAKQIAGVLTEAVTQGSGEAKDFAGVAGRVLPLSSEWGISFQQVTAGIAAITNLGLSADEAATAVRRMFVDLAAAKPSSDAANVLRGLHLSAEQLRTTLTQPQGVLDALMLLRKATNADPELTRRLFPDIRGMVGAMTLSGSHYDAAREIFAKVTAAGPETLDRNFAIRQQSQSFKAEQISAESQTALIRFGNEVLPTLLPQLKELIEDVEGLAKRFGNLPTPVKDSTVKLLELAAVAGPMAYMVGVVQKLGAAILFLGGLRLPAWALSLLGGPVGIGAAVGVGVGLVANEAIKAYQKDSMMHDLRTPGATQRGAAGAILGAYAGLTAPPELSDIHEGFHFELGRGLVPGAAPSSPMSGHGPHIPTKAEKAEAERRAREQENTRVAADKADLELQHRLAGITGDTSGFDAAARKELNSDEARAIRRAKEDGQSIDNIHREFARKRIELGLQENQTFLQAETRKEQAVDRSTEHELRAVQIKERAETALLDVQLSAARRQIQMDEQRGAPLSKILVDLQKEKDLIEQKATAEYNAARRMEPLLDKELNAANARVDALNKRKGELGTGGKSGLSEEARKAEVFQLDRQIEEVTDHIQELQAKKVDLTDKENRALEDMKGKLQSLEEEQRRLNASPLEILKDKLGKEELHQNEKWADTMLSGIHDVSRAMSDMIMKGKLDWQSLGDVARKILSDIMTEIIESQIRKAIYPMLGLPVPGGAPGGGVMGTATFPQSGDGAPGGLFNWLLGGGTKSQGGDDFGAQIGIPGFGGSSGAGGSSSGILSGFGNLFKGFGGLFGGGSSAAGASDFGAEIGIPGFGAESSGAASGGGFLSGLFGGGAGAGAAGGSGGLFGLSGGQMMGAFGAGQALGGIIKDPGNMMSWLQLGMSLLPFFLHDGGFVGGLPRHHDGLAPDESLNILQHGEMVLSRDSTRSLFSNGVANLPKGAGYRPNSKIFLADMNWGGSSGSIGNNSAGHGPVHITVHAQDADSFKRSESQITAAASRAIGRASRRYN